MISSGSVTIQGETEARKTCEKCMRCNENSRDKVEHRGLLRRVEISTDRNVSISPTLFGRESSRFAAE